MSSLDPEFEELTPKEKRRIKEKLRKSSLYRLGPNGNIPKTVRNFLKRVFPSILKIGCIIEESEARGGWEDPNTS